LTSYQDLHNERQARPSVFITSDSFIPHSHYKSQVSNIIPGTEIDTANIIFQEYPENNFRET